MPAFLSTLAERLTEAEQAGVGVVGFLAGVALLALVFEGVGSSVVAQVVLGLLGVLFMAGGSLALGTSAVGDRPV